MPVVTISRQFGAGGHTLGDTVAQRFGYQLVDRDIVAQVAKEANVSTKWVEAVEQDAGGLLMKICGRLVSSSVIERILGDTGSDFDEKKYLRFVNKVIQDLAAEGDVVLIGRGSQFILPDHEQIIKVLLVAELEDRIKFMMEHYNLTKSKAELIVQKEEKRRLTFLKLFDSRHPDDPSIYSLVINTSRTSLAEAEALISNLVGRVLDEYATPIW
jgi:cytidylate kinase